MTDMAKGPMSFQRYMLERALSEHPEADRFRLSVTTRKPTDEDIAMGFLPDKEISTWRFEPMVFEVLSALPPTD